MATEVTNEALRDRMQDRLSYLHNRKAELARTIAALSDERAKLAERMLEAAYAAIEEPERRPEFVAARQRQRELPGLLSTAERDLAEVRAEVGEIEPELAAVLREIADNAPAPVRHGL